MSQHLHILFAAGCWLKHLLMQICLYWFLYGNLKLNAYYPIVYCVCVCVCISIALNESQSEMMTKTWNHIIWCQKSVCVEYVRNFSCNFKTLRKKAWEKNSRKLCNFQWMGKSVYLSNHSSFTVKIANKSAWSIFMSWMKNQICQELVLCIIFKELKIKHELDGLWKWIWSTFATSILR